MGVATQVVYPTLFLAYITDDVKLEVALCRSGNRFMAGVWECFRPPAVGGATPEIDRRVY